MFKYVISTVLLIALADCLEDLSEDQEKCVRCICHAVTACLDILQCGKEGINLNYWLEAGALHPEASNDNNSVAYSKCMNNQQCILNVVHNYTNNILERINDINCDGEVDCRDYFAAHKFGMDAKEHSSIFKKSESKRFDLCMQNKVPSLVNKWTPRICFEPRSSFFLK